MIHETPKPLSRNFVRDRLGISVGVGEAFTRKIRPAKRFFQIVLNSPSKIVHQLREPSPVVNEIVLLQVLPEVVEGKRYLVKINSVPIPFEESCYAF